MHSVPQRGTVHLLLSSQLFEAGCRVTLQGRRSCLHELAKESRPSFFAICAIGVQVVGHACTPVLTCHCLISPPWGLIFRRPYISGEDFLFASRVAVVRELVQRFQQRKRQDD